MLASNMRGSSSNAMVTALENKETIVVKTMEGIEINHDANPTIPNSKDRVAGTKPIVYEYHPIPNVELDGLAQATEAPGGLIINDDPDEAEYSAEYVKDRYKVNFSSFPQSSVHLILFYLRPVALLAFQRPSLI